LVLDKKPKTFKKENTLLRGKERISKDLVNADKPKTKRGRRGHGSQPPPSELGETAVVLVPFLRSA
jgi:hypothetical protein